MLELTKVIYLYLLTIPVFFLIDMLWLGVIAKNLYNEQMGGLLAKNPNWAAAITFYLIYIVGIIYFAVLPGLEGGSLAKTIINAVLFGGIAYCTYDLTNLAVIKDWPLKLTFVDILWGIILTSSVATVSFYIGKLLQG